MKKLSNKLSATASRIYKSLVHNLLAMARMGVSRHEAKAEAKAKHLEENGTLEGYNPAVVEGIHSRGTMTTYINMMSGFAAFAAEHGAKRIADISEQMAIRYLYHLHDEGKSAWTISTAAAAINKAMGYHIRPHDLGLPPRRKADITRSRVARAHDNRNYSRFAPQILLAKATGLRRMSICKVRPCDAVRNADGIVIGIHVVEKGGRHRIAPVLAEYRDQLTALVDQCRAQRGEDCSMFDCYDRHIDNHHYRAEYAAALLRQLEAERANGEALFGGAFTLADYCRLRGKDAARGPVTMGHDTDLLGAVSGALGHNRIEIILRHYLYCY